MREKQSSELATEVIDKLEFQPSFSRGPSDATSLSPREIEIARLASNGLSNKEIALVLEISPWTVSTHIQRIYGKLGIHRRAALATYFANSEY